ncbi:hypothetical protein GN277_17860 [Lachnospiraceae bacterium WCA-9-b2]|uniref:Uncharacterized protein n=1 Tax=Sporofaciens musculi TaxID=2681861 RepID=A0A7X3SK98_9FIRM|nr:hypothetical protein [Sporofaciens musculi]MXP77171.1 hypothetical protein [Sporofaciens musculi]
MRNDILGGISAIRYIAFREYSLKERRFYRKSVKDILQKENIFIKQPKNMYSRKKEKNKGVEIYEK